MGVRPFWTDDVPRTNTMTDATGDATRVGLFATCLVDLYRPSVGFATAQLLEAAGCVVDVPAGAALPAGAEAVIRNSGPRPRT